MDGKLLEQFDAHFFPILKFQEHRREFPCGFEDRVHLAAQRNDTRFFIQLGECLAEPAEFNYTTDLIDFQLNPLRRFLFANWTHLDGCLDGFGLSDFTWSALRRFIQLRFPDYKGDIREVARYANLTKRNPPQVKKVKQVRDEIWQIANDGSRVRLLCRAPTVPPNR